MKMAYIILEIVVFYDYILELCYYEKAAQPDKYF